MDPIAHILNRTVAPHDQSFCEYRVHALSLRIDANQLELLPTAFHDVLYTEVKFTAHDNGMGFACELVEKVERHAVDLVVNVEAFDVFSVILHDDIDEVINGSVFIADKDFAVEDLVITEDVVDHLLIKMFRGCLEVNFHATSLLSLEIDVSKSVSRALWGSSDKLTEVLGSVEYRQLPIQPPAMLSAQLVS